MIDNKIETNRIEQRARIDQVNARMDQYNSRTDQLYDTLIQMIKEQKGKTA